LKFNDLVIDQLREEMESLVNVLNNDFETHQLYNPCTSHIAKIESSIKQDPTKLI